MVQWLGSNDIVVFFEHSGVSADLSGIADI
jgi:hypothetical protein